MYRFGKTLNNTIYKTEIIKRIGGLPKFLVQRLAKQGYLWAVNFDVKSLHLGRGLLKELKHQHWYGTCLKEFSKPPSEIAKDFARMILGMMISPIRGAQIAYKQRCWKITYLYPAMRLAVFLGSLKGTV